MSEIGGYQLVSLSMADLMIYASYVHPHNANLDIEQMVVFSKTILLDIRHSINDSLCESE